MDALYVAKISRTHSSPEEYFLIFDRCAFGRSWSMASQEVRKYWFTEKKVTLEKMFNELGQYRLIGIMEADLPEDKIIKVESIGSIYWTGKSIRRDDYIRLVDELFLRYTAIPAYFKQQGIVSP